MSNLDKFSDSDDVFSDSMDRYESAPSREEYEDDQGDIKVSSSKKLVESLCSPSNNGISTEIDHISVFSEW
jgi:hypothetical protein